MFQMLVSPTLAITMVSKRWPFTSRPEASGPASRAAIVRYPAQGDVAPRLSGGSDGQIGALTWRKDDRVGRHRSLDEPTVAADARELVAGQGQLEEARAGSVHDAPPLA